MSELTWLHLSDWHQKDTDFNRTVVGNRLIEDIRNRSRIDERLAKLDFIVFSGDLAHSGKKDEYDRAKQLLLDPLLEVTGLTPDRLFIIPGNHDLDTDRFDFLPGGLATPLEEADVVNKWLAGEKKYLDTALDPFTAFRDFVKDYTGHESPDYACTYPYTNGEKKKGNKKIVLLGINSAWMCSRNLKESSYDARRCLVGEPQVTKLLDNMDEYDIKIGVLHHPFEWLAEFDRNLVEGYLKKSLHFILCGHCHIPNIQVVTELSGNCVIIPSGALYDQRVAGNPRYTNAYNFVHLDLDSRKGVVFLRRWHEALAIPQWDKDYDSCEGGLFAFDIPIKGEYMSDTKKSLKLQPKACCTIPHQLLDTQNFRGRGEELAKLKGLLLSGQDIVMNGLQGVGKTAIAVKLTQDPDIKAWFSGGILWGTFKSEGDWLQELGKWASVLGATNEAIADLKTVDSRIDAINRMIRDRRILFVLDEVEIFPENPSSMNDSGVTSNLNSFDVFLSHNSKDKPAVKELAMELEKHNLQVWLDERELVPGRPWREELEKIIETTRTAAILVGKDGLGPWEIPEMDLCLNECVKRQMSVIPVLLPGASAKPELPLFLQRFTWVDLRGGLTEEGLGRLILGITGINPSQSTRIATNTTRLNLFTGNLSDSEPPLKWIKSLNKIEDVDSERCSKIITTFYHRIGPVLTDPKNCKIVRGFEKEDDAMELFKLKAPTALEYASDQCRLLLTKVSCVPQAIISLAKIINTRIINSPQELAQSEIYGILNEIEHGRGSVFDVFAMQINRLETTMRNILTSLSIFSPNPNTFDIKAGHAICATPDEGGYIRMLNHLVQIGLVQSSRPTRYFLINVVQEYLSERLTDTLPKERFVKHFVDFVRHHGSDDDDNLLQEEQANILYALKIANDLHKSEQLIDGINSFYKFLEKRGLYQIADDYLKLAYNALDNKDEARLCKTLYNMGNLHYYKADFDAAKRYYEKGMCYTNNDRQSKTGFYLGLAKVRQCLGDFEDAIKSCEKGIDIENWSRDKTSYIEFIAIWGEIEDLRGNYDEAKKKLNEGLSKADNDDQKSNLLSHQGWVAAHQGNFDEAERIWSTCLNLSTNNKPRIIFLKSNLGWIFDRQGKIEDAEKFFQSGLELADASGYQYGRSIILTNKGAALMHQGKYKEAEKCLNKSLAIDELSGHSERIGVTLENMGLLQTKRGQFEEAKKSFERGLIFAWKSGIPERICAIETFLGDVEQNLANYKEAEGHFKMAFEYVDKLGNPERTASINKHYGIFLDKKGEHSGAERHLEFAWKEALRIQYKWLMSSIRNALGNHYIEQKQLPKANEQFHDALKISEEISSQDMKAAALFGLARCPQTDEEIANVHKNADDSWRIYSRIGHYKVKDVDEWIKANPIP